MTDNRPLTFIWMRESWNDCLDKAHYILPAVISFEILAVMPPLLIWKYFDNRWYAMPWEILIGAPLTIGLNLFFINLARQGRGNYADLFHGFRIWPKAIAVSLLYGLIVTAGLIMLILPGVIWGLTYLFAQYSVIYKNTGIKASFVHSSAITYGFKESLLPIALLWVILEILTPGIVKADGPMNHMRLVLDLKPWAITAFTLKTLIFLPWLELAAAKAYVYLVDHNDSPVNVQTPAQ